MNEVMSFTCWRGVVTPVPAAVSERFKPIVCVPVESGSKYGSPVGTVTSNGSAGSASLVRSRSWSRNWPQT